MTEVRLLAQKLLGIMHLVRHKMNANLRQIDKERFVDPAHFPILASLKHHTYNVSELAKRFEVSLPSMSKTVTALVKRGWVERIRQEQDRRIVQLHLTNEGKAILHEMDEHALSAVSEMLSPLSPDQRQRLSNGLDTIYAALGESLDKKTSEPPQVPDDEE